MEKQSSKTFSGFAAFASHTSSASAALTRHAQDQQQQQQEQANNTSSIKVGSKQNKLKPSPLYTGNDYRLIQIFKRIGQKRDATTKSRALDEFMTYVFPVKDNNNDDGGIDMTDCELKKSDQITALSHFFFLFANKLIHDNNASVRSESLRVLGCAMYHVPKAFKILLLYQHDGLDSNVGSVGNVIGWVYTAQNSQIMEVSRIATKVWQQMKDLLEQQQDSKYSDKHDSKVKPLNMSSQEDLTLSTASIIKEQIITHVESILENSARASNLADAISVVGSKTDSSIPSSQVQRGEKGKNKGKNNAMFTQNNNDLKSTSQKDVEEIEERYERVIQLTLDGMREFLSTMPEVSKVEEDNDGNTTKYENLMKNSSLLWKHLNNTRGSFRRSTYNLISSICQNAPSIIHQQRSDGKKHTLSTMIPKLLSSEKDPANFPSLFEMILLYIASFRSFGEQRAWSDKTDHSSSNAMNEEEFIKNLCKTLQRACYGSPSSQWGPSMLPLIVYLPKMKYQLEMLAALWVGHTSAISASDAAAIVSAVSECSTYLLLKTNDGIINETDGALSIEIAQAFLESLLYYLNVPSGGSTAVIAENYLQNTLVKDICKFNSLGSAKTNCNFYHIQNWFWREGLLNTILCYEEMSEDVLRRLTALVEGINQTVTQENRLQYSHMFPLFQAIFWAKIQPKDTAVPTFQQISLMICIMKLCGADKIFVDETGFSIGAMEQFSVGPLLNWILYHTSLKSRSSEKEITSIFVMLSIILDLIPKPSDTWELILKNLVDFNCDVKKLALGLKILVRETRNEGMLYLRSETLDKVSIDTAKTIGYAEEESDQSIISGHIFFLRICAGLENDIRNPLVSMNTIQSWITTCVTKERVDMFQGRRDMLLETLLSCCHHPNIMVSNDDKLKLIIAAWYEGSSIWDSKDLEMLLDGPNINNFVQIASTLIKDEINNHTSTLLDMHLVATMWSERAWKLIQLVNNIGDGVANKLSILGLDNLVMWKQALESQDKSDFIYISIVCLLLQFPTNTERKEFLFHDDLSILVLVFMLLAKGSQHHHGHSQLHRCDYLLRLLGGNNTFSEDEFKTFISTCVRIISNALMDSNSCEAQSGSAILDWFIGKNIPKLQHTQNPEADDVLGSEVKEGDELWYVVDGGNPESDRVRVTVAKVHSDDYPNYYFTIKGEDSTKQTIPSRLKRHPTCTNQLNLKEKSFAKVIPWIEESITTNIVKPYLLHGVDSNADSAAECLNIVISRCGLTNGAGIGSLRYDIFKLLNKLEREIFSALDETNFSHLSRYLKRISLTLGYGIFTLKSADNAKILRFNCENLTSSLLEFFDRDEVKSFLRESEAESLNTALLMWISVSAQATLNDANSSKIFAIADEVTSEALAHNWYQQEESWMLMLLEVLQVLQNSMNGLPQNLISVTLDSEQSMMSSLLRVFVDFSDYPPSLCDQILEISGEKQTWLHLFETFTISNLRSSSSSILYGARTQVEKLCESLTNQSKQWCVFQILSCVSKEKYPLYTKDDDLAPGTHKHLDTWLESLDDEEANEIEEDVLVSSMWIPRHLMLSLEDFGNKDADNMNEDEVLLGATLLKWLLCLDFIDSAASSDMRNRAHICSYFNLTGAMKYVLYLALQFADLDTRKGTDLFQNISLENTGSIPISELSSFVLFRSVESIPTLFKTWWNDDCPRSKQPTIMKFVENIVAPETLRRELDRIRLATNLDEMEVNGSCVSREVIATYVQDECKLSVMIRVPPSFPLRNVIVDCQKTLGIPEKRWRYWSLQIMLMLNSQDGSILDALMLWKQNVDKEFDGVEPCPVCYSVLCVKTHAMPNLECKTCHNRFHSSCLYKWFSSSGKNQCVLCQQPWSGTKVGK